MSVTNHIVRMNIFITLYFILLLAEDSSAVVRFLCFPGIGLAYYKALYSVKFVGVV